MKTFLLIFAFFCLGKISSAQESYIRWSDDSSKYLEEFTHVIDDSDNVFVLGNLKAFAIYQNEPFYAGTYGNMVMKINPHGTVLWRNVYYNYYPGSSCFCFKNCILAPFSRYIGLSNCPPDTNLYYTGSTLNSGLLINTATGDTILNREFSGSKACLSYGSRYAFAFGEYLYKIFPCQDCSDPDPTAYEQQKSYIEKYDLKFNVVESQLFTPFKNALDITGMVFDTINEQYVISDHSAIRLYDINQNLLFTYDIHAMDIPTRGINMTHIAYNANYYAVTLSLTLPQLPPVDTSIVIIMDKKGNFISVKPAPQYVDIQLTEDNALWGVTQRNVDDTMQRPALVNELDLFQNVKRSFRLGKPGLRANKISVTKNKDVVVTGTVFSIDLDTFLNPSPIYYFRQAIDEIPAVSSYSSACEAVAIYPTLTRDFVSVSTLDFNKAGNSTFTIFNTIGQRLGAFNNDHPTISIDLSPYPPGLLFIKLTKDQSTCIYKVQKL